MGRARHFPSTARYQCVRSDGRVEPLSGLAKPSTGAPVEPRGLARAHLYADADRHGFVRQLAKPPARVRRTQQCGIAHHSDKPHIAHRYAKYNTNNAAGRATINPACTPERGVAANRPRETMLPRSASDCGNYAGISGFSTLGDRTILRVALAGSEIGGCVGTRATAERVGAHPAR